MRATDRLLPLAASQHGLVTRLQARGLGLDQRQVANLGATGGWVDLTSEVMARTGAPRTDLQGILVGVLDAGPGAVLSHLSAGRLWGLSGCPRRPLHVVRTCRGSRRPAATVVHTVRSLPPAWVTSLDSIPVVRPELLALELFALCREERAERLVESLWSMRLLSASSLARFLDEVGRRGRDGTSGLRRYVEARGLGYTPAASGLEMRTIQILADAGMRFRRQVDSGGEAWTGRVDLRAEDAPLVVEVQSERHHSALVDRAADAARIRRLEADGFVVVEVTDTEVWTRPDVVVRRVQDGWRRAAALSVPRDGADQR